MLLPLPPRSRLTLTRHNPTFNNAQVSWDVEVGDTVEMFEQICVVESDKATVPITSKFDGKIVKLHYEEGDLAATGKPLVDMEVDDVSRGTTPLPRRHLVPSRTLGGGGGGISPPDS